MSVVDCSGVGLERMGGVLVLSDITKLYKAKCPGHVDSARIHSQSTGREQKVQKLVRIPSKEIPGLISFRMDWLDLLATLANSKFLETT